MVVRTRFAPSPTGFLHIGGVRTALYSWLYARHHQGEFILRIEDTDSERSTGESVQAILDGMEWLGLDYDKGPFFQTKRYERYREVAEELLQTGKAYRCFCSKERLEILRETQLEAKEKPRYDGHCRDLPLHDNNSSYVIRFKNPNEGTVVFIDEVYGEIQVNNSELDDLIIVRSDGHPTYNFAVVIDDWDMEITHVIRGDDHINNTPRQINLFNALGADIPTFAHLPMILGEDGKRLSKRHGAISVLEFKEQGFLPHALLNYLVRLGWSFKDEEIFSKDEMIAKFDLKNISRGTSGFNISKLLWLNQYYEKNDPPEKVAQALQDYFNQLNISTFHGPELVDLIPIQADRCKTLLEMAEKSYYFYQDDILYNEDAVKKYLQPAQKEVLQTLSSKFEQLERWERNDLQQCINEVCSELNLGMGQVAPSLRVALTGDSNSPAIDVTLALIGKQRTLLRLHKILQ